MRSHQQQVELWWEMAVFVGGSGGGGRHINSNDNDNSHTDRGGVCEQLRVSLRVGQTMGVAKSLRARRVWRYLLDSGCSACSWCPRCCYDGSLSYSGCRST